MLVLLERRARLTPEQRASTYERAIEMLEEGLASTNPHVTEQRLAVLGAAAEVGGSRDGRWAISLFDEQRAMRERAQYLFGRFRPHDCAVLRRAVDRIPRQPHWRDDDRRGASSSGINSRVFPAAFAYATLPPGACRAEAEAIARDASLPGELRVLGVALPTLRGEPMADLFAWLFGSSPDVRNIAVRQLLNIARHTGAIPSDALPPPYHPLPASDPV